MKTDDEIIDSILTDIKTMPIEEFKDDLAKHAVGAIGRAMPPIRLTGENNEEE